METSPNLNRREKRMSLQLKNLDNNTHRAYKAILAGNSVGNKITINQLKFLLILLVN